MATPTLTNVDMTIYAETLIKSAARAFYPDDAVAIVDVLIRDKYLRDDEDMETRLSLPAKEIRQILMFLQQQHIAYKEQVDDLETGGSRQTVFWYVDIYRAVQTISLRVHYLFKRILDREKSARGQGNYQCPNYVTGMCNGTYSLLEAQNCVDEKTKMFLCVSCKMENEGSLDPKDPKTYELVAIDDKEELQKAMQDLTKCKAQLSSAKFPDSDKVMRTGILELLQKIRSSKVPLSSNLPSENHAFGRGSKRLEGTGRTATQKAKKAAAEAIALGLDPEEEELKGKSSKDSMNLLFLKSAHGDEFNLQIDESGGSEAAAMAGRGTKRSVEDISEAAQANYERELGAVARRQKAKEDEERKKKKKQGKSGGDGLAFHEDNSIRDRTLNNDNANSTSANANDAEEEEDDDEKAEKLRQYHEAYQRELQQQMKLLAEAESSSDDSSEGVEAEVAEVAEVEAPPPAPPANNDDDDDDDEEEDDDVEWE